MTPAAEPRPSAIGPTGRPLQPVGALFEAAFRRLGAGFGSYLLYTLAFGLLPLATALALDRADVGGKASLALFLLAFSLGYFLLVGTLAALVVGPPRRTGAIVVSAVAASILSAATGTLLPPLALVVSPFPTLAVIAAAARDAGALGAYTAAARLVRRWLGRAYLVLVGLGLCAVGLWFGWVVALSPVGRPWQQRLAFMLVCLFLWPIAALVWRNFYGDVTGRLVVREAPGDQERRAKLATRPARRRRRG